MTARDVVKLGLKQAEMICGGYLGDLTDADLLVRPVPGINHIAWQLGHLITAEHNMVNSAWPDSMPALPQGFADRHTSETSTSDNAQDFCTKAEYLDAMQVQRDALRMLLDRITDSDLEKPSPERMKDLAPTLGDLLVLQSSHWLMHAGQWAVTRRKLGRPPLF